MSYTKHNFQSGDVLYAAQLNDIEDQLFSNTDALALKQDTLTVEDRLALVREALPALWTEAGDITLAEAASSIRIPVPADALAIEIEFSLIRTGSASTYLWFSPTRDGTAVINTSNHRCYMRLGPFTQPYVYGRVRIDPGQLFMSASAWWGSSSTAPAEIMSFYSFQAWGNAASLSDRVNGMLAITITDGFQPGSRCRLRYIR